VDAPTQHRSTRDRPAKAPLSETAVVDAALAITRTEGLDAVTMRRVAAELDTGAASLYVYVKNRDELLRAMMDRVAGSVPRLTPDPECWREQVYELVRAFRETLAAHPGLASVLTGQPPTTENALAGAESLLGILLVGGIAPQDAAWAVDILMLIVTATATEADIRHDAGDVDIFRIRETFAALPPERFPLLIGHASELVSGAEDERFRFAIETFLDGLVARTPRPAGGRLKKQRARAPGSG
jgi:AcrR family transcriptional regulator